MDPSSNSDWSTCALCACIQVLLAESVSTAFYLEHYCGRDMAISVRESRCALCFMIAAAMKVNEAVEAGDVWLEEPIIVTRGHGESKITVSVHKVAGSYFLGRGSDVTFEECEMQYERGKLITQLPQSASASTALLAPQWLRECREKHCCGEPGEPLLPPRVIDVSVSGESKTVRLVESSDFDPHPTAQYVALSYCWGSTPSLVTTPANIASLKQGIPMDDLPRTVRDAVVVTRLLGARYLWVDRLCIVQGPSAEAKEDWKRQFPLMEQIYSRSLVTIAAAAMDNAEGGLFAPRSVVFPRLEEQRTSLALMPTQTKQLRKAKDEPLNSRAWCLQEEVLCTRLLFFGTDEIAWKCHEQFVRELGDGRGWSPWFSYNVQAPAPLNFSTPTKKNSQNPLLLWNQIIANFSGRDLSVPEDRLPSISGIARRFHGQLHGEYCAGLWLDQSLSQLLWLSDAATGASFRAFRRNRPSSRPPSYRAPSWSWASLDGSVSYHIANFQETDICAELLSHSVTLSGEDAFGHISAAEITLRAPAVMCYATREDLSGHNPKVWLDDSEALLVDVDVPDECTGEAKVVGEMVCLQVTNNDGAIGNESKMRCGLLLRAVGGRQGYYERLGFLRSRWDWPGTVVKTVTII